MSRNILLVCASFILTVFLSGCFLIKDPFIDKGEQITGLAGTYRQVEKASRPGYKEIITPSKIFRKEIRLNETVENGTTYYDGNDSYKFLHLKDDLYVLQFTKRKNNTEEYIGIITLIPSDNSGIIGLLVTDKALNSDNPLSEIKRRNNVKMTTGPNRFGRVPIKVNDQLSGSSENVLNFFKDVANNLSAAYPIFVYERESGIDTPKETENNITERTNDNDRTIEKDSAYLKTTPLPQKPKVEAYDDYTKNLEKQKNVDDPDLTRQTKDLARDKLLDLLADKFYSDDSTAIDKAIGAGALVLGSAGEIWLPESDLEAAASRIPLPQAKLIGPLARTIKAVGKTGAGKKIGNTFSQAIDTVWKQNAKKVHDIPHGNVVVGEAKRVDTVTVYHGSMHGSTKIKRDGLLLNHKGTTNISRDKDAAFDAIGDSRPEFGYLKDGKIVKRKMKDRGVIESKIPKDDFEKVFRELEEGGYKGFSRKLDTTEIKIKGPNKENAIELFNKNIVK